MPPPPSHAHSRNWSKCVRYASFQHLEFLFKDRFQLNCEGEVERWWFPDSWSDPGAELPSSRLQVSSHKTWDNMPLCPMHRRTTHCGEIFLKQFSPTQSSGRLARIKLDTRRYIEHKNIFCSKDSEIRSMYTLQAFHVDGKDARLQYIMDYGRANQSLRAPWPSQIVLPWRALCAPIYCSVPHLKTCQIYS